MGFLTENLHASHVRSDFQCGNSLLDQYLKLQASQDVKKRLAACFVSTDTVFANKVIGFYTLSNSSISREFVPIEWQNKYPKSYHTIPTTLLGRLAVDASFHGKGFGEMLLHKLIEETEEHHFWTLQSGIFPENVASIKIHEKLGFRIIGRREKIAEMNGVWRDVILLERRSIKF